MTVIVTVFEAAGVTVFRKGNRDNSTVDTQPGTPGLTARCRSNGPEAYSDEMKVLYLGGLVGAYARNQTTGLTRMGMLQSAQVGAVDMEAFHSRGAPIKGRGDGHPVSLGRLAWRTSLSSESHTTTIIGFQRQQRTDHLMSYAKALKKAKCESVETTIRKRRLFLAAGIYRLINERWTHLVIFGTMAGGENPGLGRTAKNRAQCLADDIRVFQATEGFTDTAPLCCSEKRR